MRITAPEASENYLSRMTKVESKLDSVIDAVKSLEETVKAIALKQDERREDEILRREKSLSENRELTGRMDMVERTQQEYHRRLSELEIYRLNFESVSKDLEEIKQQSEKRNDRMFEALKVIIPVVCLLIGAAVTLWVKTLVRN